MLKKVFYVIEIVLVILLFHITGYSQQDIVNGNLIQFNDNGAWCWYQDERVLIDIPNGKLILGADESQSGAGGSPRNGAIFSVIYDLLTGTSTRYQLAKFGCDDHNAPGLLIRPDGKYLAMYAQHYDQWNSRYRIFDGNTWTPEQVFDWTSIPGGTDYTIAYSNLYYLSAEGRAYNFARANHRTPNFLYSNNFGDTWSYGGDLTTNTSNSYNKGYYKYWNNDVDRIDFIFTEQHPRDTMTSIYHGYLQNGKTYKSDGTIADNNIYDLQFIPGFWNFTRLFKDSTQIGGALLRRCWNTDVVRYDNGVIATIITARADQYTGGDGSINPDHRFVYCRFDGSNWSSTYLGKAGGKLYSSEADYTGLAALHPNDPNTIYISTPIDPRDNTTLNKREIFKGVTADNGATWTWMPVTWKSTRDNFRPVVPAWDENHTALLWLRGTYNSAQSFDAAIVGVIDYKLIPTNLMTYVDADLSNTTLSNGSALVPTGPDSNAGADDNKWHHRTTFGNGGSILASSESGNGEDAPTLKTQLTIPKAGTYDIWLNFWANPTADWRIKAGLSENNMQIFRSMACKQVDSNAHDTDLILTGSGNAFLYQAYLGRVLVSANGTFQVFIDDHAIQTGQQSTTIGDIARTWYDGISYANADAYVPVELASFSATLTGSTVSLEWRTITELNNLGFEIERQSVKGKEPGNWSSLGFIEGKGTTSDPTDYSFEDKNIDPSSSLIRYRLKQIDLDGSFEYSDIVEVSYFANINFSLDQNYPNPFNPSTKISWKSSVSSWQILKVFDVLGNEIATLVDEYRLAGRYEVEFNTVETRHGVSLPSGVYFYQLKVSDFVTSKKMIIIK